MYLEVKGQNMKRSMKAMGRGVSYIRGSTPEEWAVGVPRCNPSLWNDRKAD